VLRTQGIERSRRGAAARRQTGNPGAKPGNGLHAVNASREANKRPDGGRSVKPNGPGKVSAIVLKMQARNVDVTAGTG